MEHVNKIVAKLDDRKRIFLASISDEFLDSSGGLAGFRPGDRLHPVPRGCGVRASAIAEDSRDMHL